MNSLFQFHQDVEHDAYSTSLTNLLHFPLFPFRFREASGVIDVWRFMRGPLVDGLYWETWYNGGNVTGTDEGFILHESKLLGVPRVRMLKVTNHSCEVGWCMVHGGRGERVIDRFGDFWLIR